MRTDAVIKMRVRPLTGTYRRTWKPSLGAERVTREEDKYRDKYLQDLGFTVLRFENRFVFQEPEYVKDEIKKVFKREIQV